MSKKIRIGLYGSNGHQIQRLLADHPYAELTAAACIDTEKLPKKNGVRIYESIQELILDNDVDLISLCSPIRKKQAEEAILCLKSGKHVYSEKPSAMNEEELDKIIQTSKKTGRVFREMAWTSFGQPYLTVREIVQSGEIGEVVQVFAQKSYPYHERRPQHEDIDGGLIMQNAIHAFRFVEHTAGVRISDVEAMETTKGNPVPKGDLKMAASIIMWLENGGVASIIANYLNTNTFGRWGNEHLRIFGTKGFIETVDGGMQPRLFLNNHEVRYIHVPQNNTDFEKNYFDMYINMLMGKGSMPLTLEEEIHPLRMAIRAKQKAANIRGLSSVQ
ncbi:MAG TPA: Gfo/Idh/MocA family oxidoreductase [Clostridia bacterium]